MSIDSLRPTADATSSRVKHITPHSAFRGPGSASLRTLLLGFPGGPVVENLPCNSGDMGLDPRSEKIPQAMEQRSPCTALLSPCSTADATAARSGVPPLESRPHSPKLGKTRTEQQRPSPAAPLRPCFPAPPPKKKSSYGWNPVRALLVPRHLPLKQTVIQSLVGWNEKCCWDLLASQSLGNGACSGPFPV